MHVVTLQELLSAGKLSANTVTIPRDVVMRALAVEAINLAVRYAQSSLKVVLYCLT
jgi:hypothetical protein